MKRSIDLSKTYDSSAVEDGIYKDWLESGYFQPENLPNREMRKDAFSIVLPPPNVTGTLHMGHAVMLAIEDAMVRFQRMSGKDTVWIPGTDHASIATESKVEKILIEKEGITRHDLGRDKFLARVEQFAQESHDTIVNQMKKMGASVDWSREAYTLDDARNLAVRTAFVKMYEDGLIYRGFRVVNWDPTGQTTVSDDEVEYKEGTATLYTFTYGKDFPIAISTTRPETKVGDTAVAVHPKDERYQSFIGKAYAVNFAGVDLSIQVIADDSVDPHFGTGALGVTPAHSQADAELARVHALETIAVIGKDGKMLPNAGALVAGKTTLEARELIAAWLRKNDLMQKEEEVMQNLSVAQRSGGAIEPLPMEQWFIAVNKEFVQNGETVTLKLLMQKAVSEKQVEILPERFEKTYFHWIDNLRDWNISRQIWFGHRIPAWHKGEEIYVGIDAPEGENWVQDPDTLDTWFSSGLWTFSTLGWPQNPPQSPLGKEGGRSDLQRYHPISVLETGYDILFFWVARMILMSTYLIGEVPFKTVYLHGLVRDEKGRKMSKSLGNVINPLDMIEKYGADATRLSLMIGATPGNDVKLSEEKIATYRNFTNKLWNISRFVLSSVEDARLVSSISLDLNDYSEADKWILSRFNTVVQEVTQHFAMHQLSLAGEKLRDFTWNEFADWYVELAKVQKQNGKTQTDDVLLYVLQGILKMWHPFMPFVTEEIYKQFEAGMLIVANWPTAEDLTKIDTSDFSRFQEAVIFLRGVRNRYKIPFMQTLAVYASAPLLNEELTQLLTRWQNITLFTSEVPNSASASMSIQGIGVKVVLEGVDIEAERARIKKELETLEKAIKGAEAQLANEAFLARAQKEVIEGRQRLLLENRENKEQLIEQLAELSSL